MSFLKQPSGAGDPSSFQPNAAANGLGHFFGADPSRVSSIANSIGNAANGIAAGGGAAAGYNGSAAPINNHLQMLDPQVLRAIMAKFQPAPRMGVYQ